MKVLVLDFLSFCFSQLSVEIIHIADYHKTFAKTTLWLVCFPAFFRDRAPYVGTDQITA